MTKPQDVSRHVFSTSFLFTIFSLVVGILLKGFFHNKRPKKYCSIPYLCYDIPSLHTLISVGAIVFMLFVDKMYAVCLFPIGLMYMYSRVKLGFHSKKAIFAGLIFGVIIGFFSGTVLLNLQLNPIMENSLAIAFFLLSPVAMAFRVAFMPVKT